MEQDEKYIYKYNLRKKKKVIGWYNLGLRDDIINEFEMWKIKGS